MATWTSDERPGVGSARVLADVEESHRVGSPPVTSRREPAP